MDYSENELVSAIKNRNPAAFEFLIQKYTKSVYYLTYNILNPTGTKEDMEECVSDVFLDVWQKIKDYDGQKGSFRSWVFMLTKYKALAYKRQNGKSNTVNIEDYMIEDSSGVESQVLDRQMQEKVVETIDTFGEVDKEIFIRRYFYDESITDIMNSLGLSRSAIDNRLLRGRKLLKEALSYGREAN